MKKIMSLILTAALAVGCLVGCGSTPDNNNANTAGTESAQGDVAGTNNDSEYTIAMITDYGDITDMSFNQTTYEACKAFAEANDVEFKYYKPTGDSTAERVASVEQAVDEGFNVIVMPGYAFGGTIVEVAEEYSDIKFFALDVAKGDILEAAVAKAGEEYDYNPDNWNLEDYVKLDNVY